MVIQLPEWDGWRISGGSGEWRIERLKKRSNGDTWESQYYFSQLAYAVEKAYEIALGESPETANDLKAAAAECRRIKTQLVNEVRKAVQDA